MKKILICGLIIGAAGVAASIVEGRRFASAPEWRIAQTPAEARAIIASGEIAAPIAAAGARFTAQGLAMRIDDGFIGEIGGIDGGISERIIMIPYADGAISRIGWLMAAERRGANGIISYTIQSHEEIRPPRIKRGANSTADGAQSDGATGIDIISASIAAKAIRIDAGRRIAGMIRSGIDDEIVAGRIIKAFHESGYSCQDAPEWIRARSIWYIGACAPRN